MEAARSFLSRTADRFRRCSNRIGRAFGDIGCARSRMGNRGKRCHIGEHGHRKRRSAAMFLGERSNHLWRHSRHSHVQSGIARPINFSEGMVPKYRPSSDAGSSQLRSKTCPGATERQPLQTGRGRPEWSRSCAAAMSIPSTLTVRSFRQIRWPGSAATRLISSAPEAR